MSGGIDKRAAKVAWRARKADWAVVSVRIGARTWLKLTPDPAAYENRMRFMLRQGGAGLAPGMAAAWRDAGAAAFTVLERLDPELGEMARARIGGERLAYWQAETGAARL
jgi:hypothetical protein